MRLTKATKSLSKKKKKNTTGNSTELDIMKNGSKLDKKTIQTKASQGKTENKGTEKIGCNGNICCLVALVYFFLFSFYSFCSKDDVSISFCFPYSSHSTDGGSRYKWKIRWYLNFGMPTPNSLEWKWKKKRLTQMLFSGFMRNS